jgi:hypothetical protein
MRRLKQLRKIPFGQKIKIRNSKTAPHAFPATTRRKTPVVAILYHGPKNASIAETPNLQETTN